MKLAFYRADLPVHHGRRRDNISAGLCVAGRDFRQGLQRRVVVHSIAGNDAAVAWKVVLADADVSHDVHRAPKSWLDSHDRPLHHALPVVRLTAPCVPALWYAKNNEGWDAAVSNRLDVLLHAFDWRDWHAGHRAYLAGPVWNKHGKDKVSLAQPNIGKCLPVTFLAV